MFIYRWRDGEYEAFRCAKWWMIKPRSGYYRKVKTTQERRRWFKDKDEDVKWRKARRNPHFLDQWGCEMEGVPSCYTMKSWKKLTKKRKQYLKNPK